MGPPLQRAFWTRPITREREPVRERKGRGEEERRVRLVLCGVERALGREDLGDVVRVAVAFEGRARGGGHVLGIPRVGVVEHGREEPEEEHEAGGDVGGGPPGRGDARDDAAAGADAAVHLGVEGVEERAGDEVRGPDHGRGRDEEAARDAANGETDLGGANASGWHTGGASAGGSPSKWRRRASTGSQSCRSGCSRRAGRR